MVAIIPMVETDRRRGCQELIDRCDQLYELTYDNIFLDIADKIKEWEAENE